MLQKFLNSIFLIFFSNLKILSKGGRKMDQINKGVCCNVKDCVYNEKGCNCNKMKIDVSLGDGECMPNGEQKHFCKSFVDKNN